MVVTVFYAKKFLTVISNECFEVDVLVVDCRYVFGSEKTDEELFPKLKSVMTASGWVDFRHNEVVGRLSGTRRVFWL